MPDAERNTELCIHPFYEHRTKPENFDDRKMRDEWQDQVYARGVDVARSNGFVRILDFGCGSGFKLMKYFSGFKTVGYEIEPALTHLRTTYPDREWSGEYPPRFIGDMLICADVIEHLMDPTDLLRRLADSSLRLIVLSTPALDILVDRGASPRLGPPDNKSHVSEWTTLEFRSYVGMHLDILEHSVPSAEQGTQMILAKPPKR